MVDSGDIKNTLYPDWIDKNFGTEQAVVDLHGHMVKAGWYTKDIKSFFAKFACDLYSNGQYCQGVVPNTPTNSSSTSTTNAVDDSHINAAFSCVNNSQVLKGITKSLNGSDSIIYKLSTGGQLQFNTDKTFIYISRNDPNRKINGTWDCNGSDATDLANEFRNKVGQMHIIPPWAFATWRISWPIAKAYFLAKAPISANFPKIPVSGSWSFAGRGN
jgi:hypothetical protein